MAAVAKILRPLLILVAGAAVGGGAAFATASLLGPREAVAAQAPADVDTVFVPTGAILAPLVFADGRLAGYVAFEAEVEVPGEDADRITARLPVLLDAVNMRTYRTPMASGPDGLLPSIEVFRKVLMEAAREAFGRGVVTRVVVTKATPA